MAPRQLHYKAAKTRRYQLKYGEIDAPVEKKERYLDRFEIAERVAQAFDEVFDWARKDILRDVPLCHRVKTLSLPRRQIEEAAYLDAQAGFDETLQTPFVTDGTPEENLKRNSRRMSTLGRYSKLIKKYEIQQQEPALPMEAHFIRIGPIAFASNQFELFQDFQHRIQARSPFIQTFIVQLAAQPERDNGSYLPTERAVEGRGFGASMYDNLVTPEAGQLLVEETVAALNDLFGTQKA